MGEHLLFPIVRLTEDRGAGGLLELGWSDRGALDRQLFQLFATLLAAVREPFFRRRANLLPIAPADRRRKFVFIDKFIVFAVGRERRRKDGMR